jgi:hypothetical protein
MRLRGYTLSISAAAALLAGCGSSQPHDPLTAIGTAFESHPIVELSRIEGTGNKTELNLITTFAE